MRSDLRLWLALTLVLVACGGGGQRGELCRAQATAAPVSPPTAGVAAIGVTWSLASSVLDERRTINVYLPPDYATNSARYPVLYMPDGGMAEDFPHVAGSVDVSIKNQVIRPVIVVGIENTDRRRDLTGVTTVPEEQKIAPHAGGADRFRQFLRDELKPQIAARYRTTGEAAIVGESFAGLFVIETMLIDPTLFDGYIAADPSVWWNQQDLIHRTSHLLAGLPAAKRVYISASDDGIHTGVPALVAVLQASAPATLDWTYEPMPAEHHSTVFPTSALHGVRKLFALAPAGR
jgi:uncharacterized protein